MVNGLAKVPSRVIENGVKKWKKFLVGSFLGKKFKSDGKIRNVVGGGRHWQPASREYIGWPNIDSSRIREFKQQVAQPMR